MSVQNWLVDVDWWSSPVRREYRRVMPRARILFEVIRDLDQDAWFPECAMPGELERMHRQVQAHEEARA